MKRKQHIFGAVFHEDGGIKVKSYSESSNQRAKNVRREISHLPNVISISPIVSPHDTELPTQFKVIIKRLSDGRQ